MALIKCPECGKDVSDSANICIHCGYKLNQEQQTVQFTHDKKESAKKSLTKGITIFLTLSVITLLFLLIDYVLSLVIPDFNFIIEHLTPAGRNIIKLLPTVCVSLILSVIMLAVPKIRKIWAILICLIINIVSALPSVLLIWIVSTDFLGFFLGIIISFITVPIAFIIGFISVVKGMIQKD